MSKKNDDKTKKAEEILTGKTIEVLTATKVVRAEEILTALKQQFNAMLDWKTIDDHREDLKFLSSAIDYLEKRITYLEAKADRTGAVTVKYDTNNKHWKTNRTVERYLSNELVKAVIIKLLGLELEYNETHDLKVQLHKQPRNYLKTVSRLTGKDTSDQPTLFQVPEADREGVSLPREVVSKNTAILGNILLQLWQQTPGEALIINNLSELSRKIGGSNKELKIYLLYLGGYTYPLIERDEKTGKLSATTEQLFKVKFNFGEKTKAKYKGGKEVPYIGAGALQFIKDEPVETIEVIPNEKFLNALDGKGLGNVLVPDEFTKLALSLTDMGYKILTYTASNKPKQKIKANSLIEALNLTKQVKSQGKPRVLKAMLKAMEDLKTKGHLTRYSYDAEKEMFTMNYSDTFIKHKDFTRKKGKEENGA